VTGLNEPDIAAKGLGTQNMYYRAKLIGARFSLQSQPGVGTMARLILPVFDKN
jgi:signal transduction histidine kinase